MPWNDKSVLQKTGYLILRSLLAIVFIVSGISKLFAPEAATAFAASLLHSSLQFGLNLVRLMAIGELVLGAMLVLGIARKSAALISFLVLISFSLLGVFFIDATNSCGCFGSILDSPINEFFLLRSFFLVFISMYLVWFIWNEREYRKLSEG